MNKNVIPTAMRAVQIDGYGETEVLSLNQITVPSPAADQVLVRVIAAGVNPVDWKIRKGFLDGVLGHELPLTLGWDVAGEIVAVGDEVKQWQVGDAIFSRPNISLNGSYADYMTIQQDEIARKPQTMNWQHAAAVPLAGLTAWQAMFDAAGLIAGDRIFIHAGAGGVGSIAIQLAKAFNATVVTSCSTANIDFVKSLGADEVFDYTKDDLANVEKVDIVFDTMGGQVQADSWQLLKENGFLVSIVDEPDQQAVKQHQVSAEFVFVQPNNSQLTEIAKLIDAGKVETFIDSVFSLEQASKAHLRSESGRVKGKVILSVSES